MSIWDQYPPTYREREVQQILQAVCSGECVAVIGLSGSGKSNLLGFIAHRAALKPGCPQFFLVDCNRLIDQNPTAFFRLLRNALEGGREEENSVDAVDQLISLEAAIENKLSTQEGICFLVDRFDALMNWPDFGGIAGSLRALRDVHKYRLTFVIATRKEIDPGTELAELFFGHTYWLGPLEHKDALWSANRDGQRFETSGQGIWSQEDLEKLVEVSWGYPSLLRAACEAYASGAPIQEHVLRMHPAIRRRVMEFWDDEPNEDALGKSGLQGHPLLGEAQLQMSRPEVVFDTTRLTSKENLLLEYFLEHCDEVCEKEDLIRAVWPEDYVFEQGVRDDSLAQLVRRLRIKIESDPSQPSYIQTIPGRGYIFKL
jgi:energy-coupling factor transporter ATP-binding protein EcfA2